MTKLNTDDVQVSTGGGTPKTLQPGNVLCKINSIQLEAFKFRPGGYHIILNLEGPDMGKDFEGFWLDKDNESLGRHKGQVGKVKASDWAFSDGETKSGIAISRDAEMLKFIKGLCGALEIPGRSGETIEDLIETFNKEKPFANKFMEFCICGKEYKNKGGYTAYELFLPKFIKGGAPFGKNVIKFNTEDHIKKLKVEPVSEFASEPTIDGPSADGPQTNAFDLG
jgi:hypothetical protein